MTRALSILAVLVVALVALERAVGSRDVARKLEVERLIDPDRAKSIQVAAASVEAPSGELWLYFRSGGVWRLLAGDRPVCQGARVEALINGLLRARAVVRASSERAPSYGLSPASAWSVALHGRDVLAERGGPPGDVLERFAIGVSLPPRASFARRGDGGDVLEIDFDPLAGFGERAAGSIPPLVDARWLAGPYPGAGRSIDRVFIDTRAAKLELVRVQRDPSELAAGEMPWSWQLAVDGIARPCPPQRAEAFLAFVLEAPLIALGERRAASSLGFDLPDARYELLSSSGETMVAEVALDPRAQRAFGYNRSNSMLGELPYEAARLLVPSDAMFVDLQQKNQWDEWMRANVVEKPLELGSAR